MKNKKSEIVVCRFAVYERNRMADVDSTAPYFVKARSADEVQAFRV